MNFLQELEMGFRKIEKGACYLAAGLVFLMIFPTTLDVILRYAFNAPLPDIFQLTEFMMVGLVYLGVAYVQAEKDHIRIEVATSWLPGRIQIGLDIFGYICGFVIFSVITWQSGRLAWEAWFHEDYTMGILHFPLWPAKSILPIGTFLLLLRFMIDIFHDLAKLSAPASAGARWKEENT